MIDNITLLIRAASAGNAQDVRRLIPLAGATNFYAHALGCAAANGHIECVKILLDICPHPWQRNGALLSAVKGQHIDCVNLLLSLFTQPFDCGPALNAATQQGNVQRVNQLLPFCARPYGSEALITAVLLGETELFNLLLPVSDPKYNDSQALYMAVEYNRTEFFDILLPLSDLKADGHAVFLLALQYGHTHFAEILYPFVDVHDVTEYVIDCEPQWYNTFVKNLGVLEAKIQHNVLTNSVSDHNRVGAARKM